MPWKSHLIAYSIDGRLSEACGRCAKPMPVEAQMSVGVGRGLGSFKYAAAVERPPLCSAFLYSNLHLPLHDGDPSNSKSKSIAGQRTAGSSSAGVQGGQHRARARFHDPESCSSSTRHPPRPTARPSYLARRASSMQSVALPWHGNPLPARHILV
jgi:hypothetical protein